MHVAVENTFGLAQSVTTTKLALEGEACLRTMRTKASRSATSDKSQLRHLLYPSREMPVNAYRPPGQTSAKGNLWCTCAQ